MLDIKKTYITGFKNKPLAVQVDISLKIQKDS